MDTNTHTAPLAVHEEMDRWERLPVWAQQELQKWRQDEAFQRGRAEGAEARQAAFDLVLAYAKDIVDAWPKTTIRTLGQMTVRVDSLKQALELLNK